MPVQSAMCGTGRWFGTATGRQRHGSRRRSRARSARSSWMPSWRIERVAQAADPVDLGRGEDDEQHERRRRANHAHGRRHGSPRGSARPAERAGAAEDREERGGEQQVAAEDRQAGGGEHAERGDRDEAGRDRQQRALAQRIRARGRARRRAAPSSPGSRRISPSRRGTVAGTSSRPVMRSQRLARCRACRVSECSGSPVDDEVAERPEHGRGGGERDQPGERACGRAATPREVGEGEQPRLGPQQAGEGEQHEHRRARARPARLGEDRAEHQRDVRDVDVRAHAEVSTGRR